VAAAASDGCVTDLYAIYVCGSESLDGVAVTLVPGTCMLPATRLCIVGVGVPSSVLRAVPNHVRTYSTISDEGGTLGIKPSFVLVQNVKDHP